MVRIEFLGSSVYALAIPELTAPFFRPNSCNIRRGSFLANMYDYIRIITLEPSLFDQIVDIVYIYRITHAWYGSNS